jgi:rhodanese-related sulfurtransferase
MPRSFLSESDIPVERAAELVDTGAAWLLDVREDFEWEAGHVASAHHIPMGQLERRADELPDDEQILVICHLGTRSRLVADALVRADYPAVNILGGMEAWQIVGLPITRGPGGTPEVV